MSPGTSFGEKRRLLQLETLYDLAVSLHAHRPEQELVDELLERVCVVLDPAAAVAVTRDAYGAARAVANVGWGDTTLDGHMLLRETLWRELLAAGGTAALMSDNLTACTFTFTPGTAQRAGLVSISLTVGQDGENIVLLQQVHIDNVP